MKKQNYQSPKYYENKSNELKEGIKTDSTFKECNNLFLNQPLVPAGFIETPFSEGLISNVSIQEQNTQEINRQLPFIINY